MSLLRAAIAAFAVFIVSGSVAHATPPYYRGPGTAKQQRNRTGAIARNKGVLRRSNQEQQQAAARRYRQTQRTVRATVATQPATPVVASPVAQTQTPVVHQHTAAHALQMRQELAQQATKMANGTREASEVAFLGATLPMAGLVAATVVSAVTGDLTMHQAVAESIPFVAGFSALSMLTSYALDRTADAYNKVANAFMGRP